MHKASLDKPDITLSDSTYLPGDLVAIVARGYDLGKQGVVTRLLPPNELIVVFELDYGWYDSRRLLIKDLELIEHKYADLSPNGEIVSLNDKAEDESK